MARVQLQERMTMMKAGVLPEMRACVLCIGTGLGAEMENEQGKFLLFRGWKQDTCSLRK